MQQVEANTALRVPRLPGGPGVLAFRAEFAQALMDELMIDMRTWNHA